MLKKAILFLGTALGIGSAALAQTVAQPCATDQHHKELVRQFPQITATEQQLEQSIRQQAEAFMNSVASKGTNLAWENIIGYAGDNYEFHIPVVVHIIHNYGSEYISDDKVYRMIENMNTYFHKRNADTVNIIKPYKEYAGNARISFHLATIDPSGQPTNGITRRYSYLTNGGDDNAKFDQWSADRYMNIWTETRIGRPINGGIIAAYSRFPADGQNNPFGDGIISNALFIGDNGTTISHEAGHYLNLLHVWNSNQIGACEKTGTPPAFVCGDDAVDDTPPTKGHFSGLCPGLGCELYDTLCATGYQKTYGPVGSSVTINFPDTVNTQNIMDYSDCTNMFTVGQIARMRATMRSTSTSRYKLADTTNLIRTGIWANNTGALVPRPDLAPIADFSVNRNFICANTTIATNTITFTDRSWRDTISSRSWTFGNATPSTSTSASPVVTMVSQPGWVTTSLTANSNAGTSTITRSDLVYAADPNGMSPNGYYAEFDAANTTDMAKYPIFNYYGLSSYKWELSNRGYFDNSSIMFKNYDPRPFASQVDATLTPGGNFSDFFTPAFDLSDPQFTAATNLTFFSAGAYRVTNPIYMNDSLQITYSTDCGNIWRSLGTITKGNLANNGYVTVPYYPTTQQEWKLNALTLPAGAKTSKVFFRFRYYSGTDNGEITGFPWGTGNNFFLDRVNITTNAVGVNGAELEKKGMTLSPNPTSGSAMITLKGGDNSIAQVSVTDITGKVVYRTEARLTNAVNQIEIPASSITVRGLYMVHVITNGNAQTQKLVVN